MVCPDVLPADQPRGTIGCVEDEEATQLVFETLFDIEAAVYDIRDVLIEPPEDEDEASEEDDT